jgi:hypothetical protein
MFVSIVPLILYASAYLISAFIYNGDFNVHWLLGFLNMSFWFLAALPFGPMGEELGWRGFLLPKLLEKHSIIKSTVIAVSLGAFGILPHSLFKELPYQISYRFLSGQSYYFA